jgi:hypothetical protein
LIIKSVINDDEGEYFCRAQNSEGFGRDSLPIYVEIKGMNLIYIENLLEKSSRTHSIHFQT